jgi:hypothetical protein
LAGSPAPRSDTDLVERVRELQPLIRSHALHDLHDLHAEQRRRVTGEVVEALTDAGISVMPSSPYRARRSATCPAEPVTVVAGMATQPPAAQAA